MKSRNGNIDININLQTKGIDYHHNNLGKDLQADAKSLEGNVKRASVPKQMDFTYYGENPVMKAYYADMADKRLRRVAYQNRDISTIENEPSFRSAFERVSPARERLEEVIPVSASEPVAQPVSEPVSEMLTTAMPSLGEPISAPVEPMIGEPISALVEPMIGEPISEMVSEAVMPSLGEPEPIEEARSTRTITEPMQNVTKAPSIQSARTVMEMPFEELRSQVPKILSKARGEPYLKTSIVEPPDIKSPYKFRPSEVSSEPSQEESSKLVEKFSALSIPSARRRRFGGDDPIIAINDFLSKQEKPVYSFKPVIQTENDLKKFFGRMRSATLKGEAEQAYIKNLPFNEFQQRENLIGMMTGQLEEQMGRRIIPNINDIIEYRLGAYLPRGIYIDDLLPENLRDEYAKNKPRRMV